MFSVKSFFHQRDVKKNVPPGTIGVKILRHKSSPTTLPKAGCAALSRPTAKMRAVYKK
jgi:hypothetical protein